MPNHDSRPMVYVAGPFQLPEPIANTRRAIDIGEELEMSGRFTACIPHLNLLWDFAHTHSAEFWYDFDLAYLARCDALLRISGESRGAGRVFVVRHSTAVYHQQP